MLDIVTTDTKMSNVFYIIAIATDELSDMLISSLGIRSLDPSQCEALGIVYTQYFDIITQWLTTESLCIALNEV
jgi:hypothetical protein